MRPEEDHIQIDPKILEKGLVGMALVIYLLIGIMLNGSVPTPRMIGNTAGFMLIPTVLLLGIYFITRKLSTVLSIISILATIVLVFFIIRR